MNFKFSPYARLSVILAFIAMLFWPVEMSAAPGGGIFDKVKTGYVLNFTRFVRWPDSIFVHDSAPFVVGFMGNNDSLYATFLGLQAKRIKKRKVEICRLLDSSDARQCHLVYLASPLGQSLESLLAQLDGQPVLTVSDQPEFVSSGGMIQLIKKQGYLRFQINLDVIRGAGLDISSQLLKLADHVIYEK